MVMDFLSDLWAARWGLVHGAATTMLAGVGVGWMMQDNVAPGVLALTLAVVIAVAHRRAVHELEKAIWPLLLVAEKLKELK